MSVKCGDSVYLFESKIKSNICLISAHGCDYGVSYIVPAGVTLHFYTPHGYTLQDPGINFLQRGNVHSIAETVREGKITYEYLLSKYQGYHGKNGETYKNIQDVIDTNDRMISALASDKLSELERVFAGALQAINVATIRNTSDVQQSGGYPLSWTIAAIRKKRPNISVFHCSFCRSTTPDMTKIPGYVLGGV